MSTQEHIARLQADLKRLHAAKTVQSRLVKGFWKVVMELRHKQAPMSEADSQAYFSAISHHASAAKDLELTTRKMRIMRMNVRSLGGGA